MSGRPAASRLPGAFYRLLTASAATNLGDGLLAVAMPWLATAITRDPLLIALAALAGRLPWLLFALPAGVISDRFDRRRLLVGSDMARAAILLAFSLFVFMHGQSLDTTGTGRGAGGAEAALLLVLLYAAALLTGFAEVLRDNTAQTFLPSLVDRAALQTANGRLWAAELVTNQFIGPPLAGVLIALNAGAPLASGAAAYAFGAAVVVTIRGSFSPHRPAAGSLQATPPASWTAQLREGVLYLWRDDLLRTLAVTLGVLNGAGAISAAVFVLFAQEVLGVTAGGFGLLLTGFAAGGLVGSLVGGRIAGLVPVGRLLVGAIVVLGVQQLAMGLAHSALLVWFVAVGGALIGMVWNMVTVSLRQSLVPDHLLGRVNSVYRFFAWGTISLGSLLGGVVVTVLDPWQAREWALRASFILAALLHAAVLLYAAPRLTTARVEAAKAGTETGPRRG